MEDIAKIATLGLSRASGALPPLPGGLAAPTAPTEHAFLYVAGAAAIARRAAKIPLQLAPGSAAPEEIAPILPRHLVAPLARLLRDRPSPLLDLALDEIAAAGRVLPASLLALALDVAPPATRDRALAILGERGRWLAGENPAWEWASRSRLDAAPSESDWHEGPPPRRAAYLASLRAADPPAARLVLESSWKTEKADARIEFLALLQTGLSAADLPFLETALADRSDRVADEAARLCALLPDSPQSTFLRDRASEILESPLKGRRLDFSAPQTYLDSFADVFRQSKPKDPVARRKLIIQRTLASAPVDVWTRRLGLKPAQLFAAIDPAELADVAGRWLDAAAVQHRSDWLLAFLDSLVAGAFSKAGFAADGLAARALSGLSPTELLGRYSALVDYWAREGVGPVEDLLQWPPFRPTWSEAQSAEIVPAVRQAFVRFEALAASRGRIEENPALCTLIELAAFGVPIAEAPALLAQFRTEDLPLEVAAALKPAQRHAYDRMRSGLEVVREIVELRLLLHRELSAAPPAPAKESS